MAKRCSKCGFGSNPNDAHYCGKCGNNIADYGNVWKVYNSSLEKTYHSWERVISYSRLKELEGYERKVKESVWRKSKEKISDLWDGIDYYFEENGWKWGIGGAIVVALILIVAGIKSCSSDNKIVRVEVDGKYGIGYDKDNLLVPAIYDSIDKAYIGNQWSIYDPKANLKGLAYVTDSVQNVIAPEYTDIWRGAGHYTVLRKSPKEPNIINYYEYVAYDGKIMNEKAFNALKPLPDISNPSVFRERQVDSQHQLYNLNLEKIGPSFYRLVECWEDSVLVGHTREECQIYDFKGNKINTYPIYKSELFNDGVAWAYKSKNDYQQNKLCVIDPTGKQLFYEYSSSYYPVGFSEGIGFYKSKKNGRWVAVDKKGMELFDIEAYSVYPFTMGLAPVYKGKSYLDRKLGFVDKQGNVVIPFKYETSEYQPKFGRDSLMSVTLDGKGGKLHRNGTFYPEGVK